MSDVTPEDLLEAIGQGGAPAEALRQLVANFPGTQIREALRGRVAFLWKRSSAELVQLLTAFGDDALNDELAAALSRGFDMGNEHAWVALSFLDDGGHLENWPELAEWLLELDEAIEQEAALSDELVEQIESEPDGVWLALRGLDELDAEARPPLIQDLGRSSAGPGVVELLRILIHSEDRRTRAAALAAMEALDLRLTAPAWSRLAGEHPDSAIAEGAAALSRGQAAPPTPTPSLRSCLVTTPDSQGRGLILLSSETAGEETTACFLIDLMSGVREVTGGFGPEARAGLDEEFVRTGDREAVEGDAALALGLLAGAMTLRGEHSPLSLRFWLERTVGPSLVARPFAEAARGAPNGCPEELAREVLEACPWWVDDSDLVYELAEELSLRGPTGLADAGAIRFLFENRLGDRLELDRRCLLWMAAFWEAQGRPALREAALALAAPLLDPQHAVPGNAFVAELARRSIARAQEHLEEGIDLRDPDLRRQRRRGEI